MPKNRSRNAPRLGLLEKAIGETGKCIHKMRGSARPVLGVVKGAEPIKPTISENHHQFREQVKATQLGKTHQVKMVGLINDQFNHIRPYIRIEREQSHAKHHTKHQVPEAFGGGVYVGEEGHDRWTFEVDFEYTPCSIVCLFTHRIDAYETSRL